MSVALAPLAPTGAVTRSTAAQTPVTPAVGAVTDPGVSVTQIFTGPTTSGGRLDEINWTIRHATQARRETIGGVAR